VRIGVGVVVIVAAVAQVRCGSESGAQSGNCDAGCLTPADDTFLTNLCTALEACCVANLSANGRTTDIAACKRTFAASGFSHDSALQAQCLNELQARASAGGAGCLPEVGDLASACSRLVYEPNGSVEPGQPCTTRSDCAGEAGSITLCIGVCVRMAHGKAGDGTCLGDASDEGVIIAAPASQAPPLPSITTGVLCERRAGLYCMFAQDKALQTCTPLRAGGVACDYSRTCASKVCYNGDSTQGGLTGTCLSHVSAGQTCGDVPTTACDDASYCNGDGITPGVCVAKLPGGSSCDADWLCLNDTCANGVCSSTTDAQEIAIFGYCSRVP
jgi:hypothetical protein